MSNGVFEFLQSCMYILKGFKSLFDINWCKTHFYVNRYINSISAGWILFFSTYVRSLMSSIWLLNTSPPGWISMMILLSVLKCKLAWLPTLLHFFSFLLFRCASLRVASTRYRCRIHYTHTHTHKYTHIHKVLMQCITKAATFPRTQALTLCNDGNCQ